MPFNRFWNFKCSLPLNVQRSKKILHKILRRNFCGIRRKKRRRLIRGKSEENVWSGKITNAVKGSKSSLISSTKPTYILHGLEVRIAFAELIDTFSISLRDAGETSEWRLSSGDLGGASPPPSPPALFPEPPLPILTSECLLWRASKTGTSRRLSVDSCVIIGWFRLWRFLRQMLQLHVLWNENINK